jgi:hypothetical protein
MGDMQPRTVNPDPAEDWLKGDSLNICETKSAQVAASLSRPTWQPADRGGTTLSGFRMFMNKKACAVQMELGNPMALR